MTIQDCVQQEADFLGTTVLQAIGPIFAQKLHENVVVEKVYDDSEGVPTTVFKLRTERWMRNGHDIVHGGCIATIVDYYTTLALASDPRYYEDIAAGPTPAELSRVAEEMGVSRSLSVQYIQAVPLDAYIYIQVKLVSNTKRNSYFTCVLRDSNHRILVTGTHDKVKVSPRL